MTTDQSMAEHFRRLNLTNPSEILDALRSCTDSSQLNGLWSAISEYYGAKGCRTKCTGPDLALIFRYSKYSGGYLGVSNRDATAIFCTFAGDWQPCVQLGDSGDIILAALIALFQYEARAK